MCLTKSAFVGEKGKFDATRMHGATIKIRK
jgi:hypothetical protein